MCKQIATTHHFAVQCTQLWYARLCYNNCPIHYGDVIMGTMTSQITSLTIVYSTVYSGADQSSASLAFVRGIHRSPVTGKCFHLMTSSWNIQRWFVLFTLLQKGTMFTISHLILRVDGNQHRAADFNTLRPKQNCRHFADDIFKLVFSRKIIWTNDDAFQWTHICVTRLQCGKIQTGAILATIIIILVKIRLYLGVTCSTPFFQAWHRILQGPV